MPHHEWGDDWPHWNLLYRAIREVEDVWKWGRIAHHGKEKWGTFRDQLWPWDGTLTGLLYPGYVRIMTPRWFYWGIDQRVIRPVLQYTGTAWLIRRYQRAVYNYGIQRACRMYPEVVDELVVDLDGYEMVRPGIFGNVDGTEIHNKYWRRV